MAISGSITIYDRTQNNADVANIESRVTTDQMDSKFQRYIRAEIDGLHVGDSDTESEALIDSDSFQIVINKKTYSKLAADYVQFGNYRITKTADGGLALRLAEGSDS